MDNNQWEELRHEEIRDQAQWVARQFLQTCFTNKSRQDVYEELKGILEFEDTDFVKAFNKSVSLNLLIVSKILNVSTSEHGRRETPIAS